MESFWQTSFFVSVIYWVTLLVLLVLIFSPFIIIGLKRFRPVKWYYIPIVYVISWLIDSISIYVIDFITDPLARLSGFTNIVFSMEDAWSWSGMLFFLLLPLTTFYIIKSLLLKFTLKNIIIATACSVLLAYLEWQHLIYEIGNGFGGLLF